LFPLTIRLPRRSPLLPYTTLFRSNRAWSASLAATFAACECRTIFDRADAARRLARELGRTAGSCRGSLRRWLHAAGSRAQCRARSEEHTSELQSRGHLVCRLLLEK